MLQLDHHIQSLNHAPSPLPLPLSLPLPIGGLAPLASLALATSFAAPLTLSFASPLPPSFALHMNKANRLERRIYKQKEECKYATYLDVFPSTVAFCEDHL
jgi:hypothetical protein